MDIEWAMVALVTHNSIDRRMPSTHTHAHWTHGIGEPSRSTVSGWFATNSIIRSGPIRMSVHTVLWVNWFVGGVGTEYPLGYCMACALVGRRVLLIYTNYQLQTELNETTMHAPSSSSLFSAPSRERQEYSWPNIGYVSGAWALARLSRNPYTSIRFKFMWHFLCYSFYSSRQGTIRFDMSFDLIVFDLCVCVCVFEWMHMDKVAAMEWSPFVCYTRPISGDNVHCHNDHDHGNDQEALVIGAQCARLPRVRALFFLSISVLSL